MSIETVLATSAADRNSLPARLADRVVCIGAAPAAQSYLNVSAIIMTAKGSGAGFHRSVCRQHTRHGQ
jgi:acetyl-CoA carboxylase biotin carboxylase subunit